MRTLLLILAAGLSLSATVAGAQVTPEFRPFVGAFVPTGDHADVLKSSMLVGGQVAVEVRSTVHLVGTLAYATPETDGLAIGKDVHLFQYDVGAEFFKVVPMSQANDHWTFRPFIGAGLGARTHDVYDRNDLDAQTNLAGYAALGGEIQHQRIALRLEARDYVTRFNGLAGGDAAEARNDLMIAAGLAIHIR
jgi:hypothetical protein